MTSPYLEHTSNSETQVIPEPGNEAFEDLDELSRRIGITWIELINAATKAAFIHQESTA